MARNAALLLLVFIAAPSWSDGSSIGQIYQPYVQPLEREIEYVALFEDGSGANDRSTSRHKVGFGASVSDNHYLELALNYRDAGSTDLESIELEAIIQLTEQGEYDSDWGMLVELEHGRQDNPDEFTVGLLNSRNFGRLQLTTNLNATYEWGDDFDNELETSLSTQLKYRYSREIEPAIELFIGQDSIAAGPGVTGQIRFGAGRSLRWNGVLLFGGDQTPDHTVKLEFEYEFF